MSAHQIGPRGMTAFVPNGDSRQDTAVLLLAAAEDHGLDQTRDVVAAPGGFYISDALADALGSDPDLATEEQDAESEAESESEPEPGADNPEVDKAEAQLEAEGLSEAKAEEAVEAAVTEPAKANAEASKKTSGNRAAKTKNSEEE